MLQLDNVVLFIFIQILWSFIGGFIYSFVDRLLGVRIEGSFYSKSLSTSIRIAWGGLNTALLVYFLGVL